MPATYTYILRNIGKSNLHNKLTTSTSYETVRSEGDANVCKLCTHTCIHVGTYQYIHTRDSCM